MVARFGFISTYPPVQCGLATFTAALRSALTDPPGNEGVVARVVEPTHGPASPSNVHANNHANIQAVLPSRAAVGREVVADLVTTDLPGSARAVTRLNGCDVVIVQHEFGIYGGTDGSDILGLLAALDVPSIVVLHTVLIDPTPNQRAVLEAVTRAASAVVTMSQTAHDRLAANYNVDLSKVRVIPHGAPEPTGWTGSLTPQFRNGPPTILTWGLLGPGKGIEWSIEAMAELNDLRPRPHYIVAGQTHPKVVLREGEAYRERLAAQIARLGLSESVTLDGAYRGSTALSELVASADVVVLPYDSTDQVTSGVLIEAVAAGKPVIATAFSHAVELLAGGAGLVVAHKNPQAIAAALRSVLSDPSRAAAMSGAAAATAPSLRWSSVAEQYRRLATQLVATAASQTATQTLSAGAAA